MISRSVPKLFLCLVASLAWVISAKAELVSATIPTPSPAETGYFKLGSTKNPDGHELGLNSRSLLLDGQPWFPVMGEMHYSRVPASEWREELLKLKAGGIDVVATYIFWIHHEEVEGQWDWSGQRDLRKFIQTCNDVGLKVIVRCGPWDHGEVRNGGFPDWVVAHKDWKLRSMDANFMAAVKILYAQIATQLQGEYWKDGGPVIGIQVDNEFSGSPAYLMALKNLAIESGIDVPYYTKTGWPILKHPLPLGELIPLFGGYADGFWLHDTHGMPGDEWKKYLFSNVRTDAAIGVDQLGKRKAQDQDDISNYPYLCCEIGGGMMTSYHRRISLTPADIESLVLCQLGSGTSLLGYYMYHGGQNPAGQLSTLNESLATGYPNDLPVKNYDFNAPIGEYGQLNPQYHWLRRLHLFVHDFGGQLATMPTTLPAIQPTSKTDLDTLRWAVRSDGQSGYVFVNNYERLQPMPAHTNVQFQLQLAAGNLVFPAKPVTIPTNEFFFWPFNLDLGGARLIYATAQPICKLDAGNVRTIFFAETPGVKAEFAWTTPAHGPDVSVWSGQPKRKVACKIKTAEGREIHLVLLSEADSLALWKGSFLDGEHVFLSLAALTFDRGNVTLESEDPSDLNIEAFPAGKNWLGNNDGIFRRFDLPVVAPYPPAESAGPVDEIQAAGPAREIILSQDRSHQTMAPDTSDFTNAAIYRLRLPPGVRADRDPMLRIHYTGDVARITLNGRLLEDDFYSGREFDLGLKRYLPDIQQGDLWLRILPLRSDAPIFLEDRAKPDFDGQAGVAKLDSIKFINHYRIVIKP